MIDRRTLTTLLAGAAAAPGLTRLSWGQGAKSRGCSMPQSAPTSLSTA